jgi:hypothetical protein
MWITCFVTYLSIAFHIYLLIIMKNVSILTDFTYLVPPFCLCGILTLRSHDFWEMTLTAKHVFGIFTFYRRFCTAIFFIWNKIFIQPRGKYITYINQKCYFLLWLFQLRWTLIQHFQVFHVNKPNTCFAVRAISQKSCDLKARI